jgi:hypothetical protein
MKIANAIMGFGQFLNASWNSVDELIRINEKQSSNETINDWLQANWELLVERRVLGVDEYLQVYGEGADFNGSSSRITDFKSIATHRIVVKSRSSGNLFDALNNVYIDENDSYEFDMLVGFENGFYHMMPIFSHLLVYDNSSNIERVFRISDVDFELQKM